MRMKRIINYQNGFEVINTLIMLAVCFVTLYPLWYILINSLNESQDAMRGGIYWLPRLFSLQSYKVVFSDLSILNSFKVTILRTIFATILNVFFTSMVAYAISKKYLIGRKIYVAIGTVTLFFSGGLIPYFLLIKSLGLYDNFLVYILPGMFNFFNLIIFQSFFRELPASLEESAKIDGANDFKIFIRIILPLSKPVLATIALFVAVSNWNDYFMGVLFTNKESLLPIQTFLYRIISQTGSNQMLSALPSGQKMNSVTSESIKLATMVVTTLPIVFVYPFVQKYFAKGLILGSIKG